MKPGKPESGVLELAVAAGFYHPDSSLRGGIREALDRWLAALGDGVPEKDPISGMIRTETGTVLEPFELNELDIECAAFLARVALSKTCGATRFRVVSRDTIGSDGGLVITNNLKCYYAERFALGEHHRNPTAGWAFVPAELPVEKEAPARPVPVPATLATEEDGFRITIRLPDARSNPARFARGYQQHSRIIGAEKTFDRLGLRVECTDDAVHVLSGSPEAMIRVMAHMVEGSILHLQNPSDPEIPIILAALEIPEEQPVPLRALVSSTPFSTPWLKAAPVPPIGLSLEHRLAISAWLRPHPGWLREVFDHLS